MQQNLLDFAAVFAQSCCILGKEGVPKQNIFGMNWKRKNPSQSYIIAAYPSSKHFKVITMPPWNIEKFSVIQIVW